MNARALLSALLLFGVCAAAQQSDPNRPILRRGTPEAEREPAQQPAPSKAPPAYAEIEVDAEGRANRSMSSPTLAVSGTPEQIRLIERARTAAFDYDSRLPNFICDQNVVRYKSETFKPEWKRIDRVSLELAYFGGKEDYRNFRVNGKPLKKGSPEDSGTWSMGDFGTILKDVFADNTAAKFVRREGKSTAAGLEAEVFEYKIDQANSHYTLRFGFPIRPAYSGAVWIDPESANTLRIEINTRQFPKDYEIDTAEMTTDYGWVTISGERYLLPVRSENLACFRDTFTCVRNEIEYTNYRKFSVESQVLQVESEISFPDAGDDKKPAGKTTPPSITPDPPKTPKKK